MDKIRKIALDILIEYERENTYTNLSLKKHLRNIENERDKKFISALVYGVIEKKIFLDFYISKFSSVKLKKINVVVLTILRMGFYQLQFMNVPQSAACNTSVTLAKTNGQYKSAGFVNAILRKLATDFDKVVLPEKNTIEYLSVKYSISQKNAQKLIDTFGLNGFVEFMDNINSSVNYLYAAVNTKKVNSSELIEQLEKNGIVANLTEFDGLIKISSGFNIENSDCFKKGLFHIIGYTSYIAAMAAKPDNNQVVYDVCSAPGGKTFAIAYKTNNTNKIYSFDLHEHKIANVKNSCERLGLENIVCSVMDATCFNESLVESADVVLCDVPCSGLGMIFKKPDIKYKDIDFDSIVCTQKKILSNASKYLKNSGKLIYSTCTVNKEENIDVINEFLNDNSDFYLDTDYEIYKNQKGQALILPDENHSEGFYVAVLSKK